MTSPGPLSRPAARALAGLLVGALVGALAACGEEERFADYCEEVLAQQKPLSEALAPGGPTALIDALPSFRALQAKSPGDISDEWGLIVGRIETLTEALDAAGVDPATYDRDDPPAGLSEEDRTAIDAAAGELATPATAAALEGVQQQARDVCQAPLNF